MKSPIGILGLGDLGNQLARQIAGAGFEVIIFDTEKKDIQVPGVRLAASEVEVLDNCSIVHWAIPSRQLMNLGSDLQNVTVVLHDSVMNSSLVARDCRRDSSNFAIVHCLMNDAKRAFVASDASQSEEMMRHFKSIGLSPRLITTKAHDTLMAHSQGVLATFIELGLRDELDEAARDGDLTPSAGELHRVLMNRELNWTPNTLKSILSNPELNQVAADIVAIINKMEDNRRLR